MQLHHRSILLSLLFTTFITFVYLAAIRSDAAMSHGARVEYAGETRQSSGWRAVSDAPPTANISLLFALRHSPEQLADLYTTATSVSTPGSEHFRKYLSWTEMNARFTPPIESERTVMNYLESALGINSNGTDMNTMNNSTQVKKQTKATISVPAAGWIRVEDITVEEAQELLHTNFKVYQKSTEAGTGELTKPPTEPIKPVDHSSDAPIIRATIGYSLPSDVALYVDFVGGVTKLPTQRFQAQAIRIGDSTTEEEDEEQASHLDGSYIVTPKFLRTLYNIPKDQHGTNSASMRQVVPQFLEQFYSPSDLQIFLQQNRIEPKINVSRVLGMNLPEQPGGEASLDIQLIMGLAPGVRTELWSFSGRRDNTKPPSNTNQEPFLDWMVMIASEPNPPLVHSVSYADDEKDCTVDYMKRLDVEFQKAAARGLTILFASGDDGAGSVDVRDAKTCTQMNPTFPSSSPWITSIGGTQLEPKNSSTPYDLVATSQRKEVTCSSRTGCVVTTGGGFSQLFPRPDYQQSQVVSYLASNSSTTMPKDSLVPSLVPPPTWFNNQGRGYPDIATLATNYEIFLHGHSTRIGGTSASSPVVGAMISLWNEILLAQGKPPLGFINPWLYRLQQAYGSEIFHDVTSGDNACSQNVRYCCPHGFSATVGWDAVTGVGTPDWLAISKLLDTE